MSIVCSRTRESVLAAFISLTKRVSALLRINALYLRSWGLYDFNGIFKLSATP